MSFIEQAYLEIKTIDPSITATEFSTNWLNKCSSYYRSCGRGLGINRTPSDTLRHDRIKRQTVRVIHIIIFGQPTKDRLAQQAQQ